MDFNGFEQLEENALIRIPKQLIDDLLKDIRSLAELKVTLFIYRHTFCENLICRHISLNDFMNGIKSAEDQEPFAAVGLARQHIINGVALAEDRGTILVYRKVVRGHENKWYFINTTENKELLHALQAGQLTIEELTTSQSAMLSSSPKAGF